MAIIFAKLKRAFRLTQDLVDSLEEYNLQSKLPNLPSNTIGDQLWCMVGARESYLKAIKNGRWVDFSCSLRDVKSKPAVLEAVSRSGNEVMDFLDGIELNETQLDFLFELLEHEIQHHGQLIRYMYGNKLRFPQSWRDRYTV